MKFFNNGKTIINYEDYGCQNNEVICFSNSLGTDSRIWHKIIDYFKNSEIELICWDDDLIKRKQLINQKIRLHNLSDPEIWADIDTLFISPGIPYLYPKAHPAVINALENSVRIDNDIGLFFRNMINKNKKVITILIQGNKLLV